MGSVSEENVAGSEEIHSVFLPVTLYGQGSLACAVGTHC